jgi:membrane associated rhomboid family serine protease
MSSFLQEIKNFYSQSNVINRLIVINAIVFIIVNIISLASFLSNNAFYFPLEYYLGVPADLANLLFRPYTLITYMFTHKSLFHIFFNMLLLYWGGLIFREFLGARRLLATYVLGALIGAFFYILNYNLFPVFQSSLATSYAIGASAGVLAVFIAIATYLPNYTIVLLLFGSVKLKWVALVMVIIDFINIQNGNAGGHLAHLGGAIYGFVFAKQLKSGRDLGDWFSRLLDKIATIGKRKSKIKVVHSKASNQTKFGKQVSKDQQERIDKILDKISKSGYENLTADEKRFLFDSSKNI